MKIAHFADKNSFSYLAATRFAKGQYLSCHTIEKCFDAIEKNEADVCVVPLENSVEGAVGETMDLLAQRTAYITSQIVIPISHCLIGAADEEFGEVKKVYSHYQALAQCRNFLQNKLPQAEIFPEISTSDALKKIEKGTAAIARQPLEGQKVICSDIQDYKTNATKFVVLKPMPTFEGNKCSVLFETSDEPGSLLKVLSDVANHGVNMTKIESRPQKTKLGRYVFFADMDFDKGKEELTKFLAALQERTARLKFLGKYYISN